MKLSTLSALSAGALLSTVALVASAHGPVGPGHVFERFDANKDGKITRTEVHSHVTKRFSEADANGDKVVTQEEAKKHHEKMRAEHRDPKRRIEARFKALDKNKNGKLERAETKIPDAMFKKIDKNNDGAITRQEALDAHQARAKGPRDRKGKPEAKGKKGPSRGDHFKRIDTSGDGKITVTEAKGAADRVFSRIDKNKDNVVTRAEVGQAIKDRHDAKDRKGPPARPEHSKKR